MSKSKTWSDAELKRQKIIRERVVDWARDLPDEAEQISPADLVDRIFADCLAFLFLHCFKPPAYSLDVAQRRFLCLVYLYRPDLVEGRSVQQIAREVGVTKGAIGQQLSAMRREIGATGVSSMSAEGRRKVREGQMRARLKPKKRRRGGRGK